MLFTIFLNIYFLQSLTFLKASILSFYRSSPMMLHNLSSQGTEQLSVKLCQQSLYSRNKSQCFFGVHIYLMAKLFQDISVFSVRTLSVFNFFIQTIAMMYRVFRASQHCILLCCCARAIQYALCVCNNSHTLSAILNN